MHFETLNVTQTENMFTITLHRPQHRNSINARLLQEMQQVLDMAEQDAQCRFVLLQGENSIFCTGMDFQELMQTDINNTFALNYMSLLKRFTTTSKIIIATLDGQVLAGGVGLAVASDLIISTPKTQFSLSEALWGLLPACVMPFLIRRIGFQKSYYLTLTTKIIQADEALSMGLIDEMTDDVEDTLRRLLIRLTRVSQETVGDLKAYFRKMWIITEEMEAIAVNELNRLTASTKVQTNISNFMTHQQFPW